MALQPNIILAGQAPDVVGAMERGRAAAQGQSDFNRQNALARLYQQQGAGIAAGNQGSINALAAFDPMAAQGVQSNILGMQGQKQEMAFSAERMQMARDEGKARAAEALQAQAANLTAAQLAAEKDAITKGLSGAAFFYQNKDQAGYERFLTQNGMNPADFPFEEFPAQAAMFEGALEAMDAFAPPTINPNDRFKVAGSTLFDLGAEGGPMPVGQGATPEETIYGPDGKPIVTRGGAGTAAKFTEAQSKDTVFATRAEGALRALEPVAGALTGLGDRALDLDPTGLARGALQSDAYQTARQSGDEFLQAILRKDTGAAITEQEQKLYGKTYLPQPGDNEAVLEFKRASRARAVEAIRGGMNQAQIEAVARADAAALARIGAEAPAAPTGEVKRLRYNPATGDFE